MDEETLAWIDRCNARGLSGMLTDKTPGDKETSEWIQLQYWIDAMLQKYSVETSRSWRTEKDSPDFLVVQAGVEKSVEVTEFVNGTFLAKVVRERAEGRTYTCQSGAGFFESQRDREGFLSHLATLINEKQKRYLRRGMRFHTLAIVCDEIWLNKDDVADWLSQDYPKEMIEPFEEVYFVMGYDPAPPSGHPIFRLA